MSPNRQYRGILSPTTAAQQGPELRDDYDGSSKSEVSNIYNPHPCGRLSLAGDTGLVGVEFGRS